MFTPSRIYVKCPMCEFVNEFRTNSFNTDILHIVTCDNEEGGCGKDFIVSIHMKPVVATAQIGKIEPQDPVVQINPSGEW
jgi:phage FluMu protein Com